MASTGNLFADIPARLSQEEITTLMSTPELRIERIVIRMEPGDHVHIPAHRRHRVEWTDPAQATVWLAVHHR